MKKTVVICGANVIGAAAAQALAEAGWNAALLDADLTKAQDAVKNLPGALPLCCDPLSERSVKDAVKEAAEHFGGLNALVWADLSMRRAPLSEVDGNVLAASLKRNAIACLNAAKAAAPYLAAAGGGRIVNLSSVHSHVADGFHMEYAVSTSAINAITRELAVSYWKDNIQVNTVSTCFVDGLFDDALDMDQRQKPEQISLLGRRVTGADVARTIRFLVTCKTKCVNGSEVRADAGYLTTQYRVGDTPFTKITG